MSFHKLPIDVLDNIISRLDKKDYCHVQFKLYHTLRIYFYTDLKIIETLTKSKFRPGQYVKSLELVIMFECEPHNADMDIGEPMSDDYSYVPRVDITPFIIHCPNVEHFTFKQNSITWSRVAQAFRRTRRNKLRSISVFRDGYDMYSDYLQCVFWHRKTIESISLMMLIKQFDADYSFLNLFSQIKTVYVGDRVFTNSNNCDLLVDACPTITDLTVSLYNLLLAVCSLDKINHTVKNLTLTGGDSGTGILILPYFITKFASLDSITFKGTNHELMKEVLDFKDIKPAVPALINTNCNIELFVKNELNFLMSFYDVAEEVPMVIETNLIPQEDPWECIYDYINDGLRTQYKGKTPAWIKIWRNSTKQIQVNVCYERVCTADKSNRKTITYLKPLTVVDPKLKKLTISLATHELGQWFGGYFIGGVLQMCPSLTTFTLLGSTLIDCGKVTKAQKNGSVEKLYLTNMKTHEVVYPGLSDRLINLKTMVLENVTFYNTKHNTVVINMPKTSFDLLTIIDPKECHINTTRLNIQITTSTEDKYFVYTNKTFSEKIKMVYHGTNYSLMRMI